MYLFNTILVFILSYIKMYFLLSIFSLFLTASFYFVTWEIPTSFDLVLALLMARIVGVVALFLTTVYTLSADFKQAVTERLYRSS